jgi:hypothetical protein
MVPCGDLFACVGDLRSRGTSTQHPQSCKQLRDDGTIPIHYLGSRSAGGPSAPWAPAESGAAVPGPGRRRGGSSDEPSGFAGQLLPDPVADRLTGLERRIPGGRRDLAHIWCPFLIVCIVELDQREALVGVLELHRMFTPLP